MALDCALDIFVEEWRAFALTLPWVFCLRLSQEELTCGCPDKQSPSSLRMKNSRLLHGDAPLRDAANAELGVFSPQLVHVSQRKWFQPATWLDSIVLVPHTSWAISKARCLYTFLNVSSRTRKTDLSQPVELLLFSSVHCVFLPEQNNAPLSSSSLQQLLEESRQVVMARSKQDNSHKCQQPHIYPASPTQKVNKWKTYIIKYSTCHKGPQPGAYCALLHTYLKLYSKNVKIIVWGCCEEEGIFAPCL